MRPKQTQIQTKITQEKTSKHEHFGWDGVRDKQEPSLGQTGPFPGATWDPSLGQISRVLLNSSTIGHFVPFVLGTIVSQGPSEKCLCSLCLLVFCPQKDFAQVNSAVNLDKRHPISERSSKCWELLRSFHHHAVRCS